MPLPPADARAVLGRARELQLVAEQLERARSGDGSAALFVGEPGSGKTTLLQAARELASGFLVVGCRGVEWEAELPYSGLQELLAPLLVHLGSLPEPQQDALEAALGMRADDRASAPLHAYVGVLSLLAEATRDAPVLVIVDDLQWVDGGTVDALAFIARRLPGERIALIAGTRPGTVLSGADRRPHDLTGLDRSAVATLAERVLGRPLPEAVIDDLAAASGGNPLAVRETVRRFGDQLGRRGSLLDSPLPVGELIDRGFAERVGSLTPDGLAAAELVAASVTGDVGVALRALDALGVPHAGLEQAEQAEVVVVVDGTAEFVHPLLRSLVHRRSERATLRRCHAALAGVLESDPDLRAWHAASAALGPDASIAQSLADAAERFAARGGHLAAARAFERAAQLSPDVDERADRLRRAGRAAHRSGRLSWAIGLLTEATVTAHDPVVRLRAEYERTLLDDVDARIARHLEVGTQARHLDPTLAANALAAAVSEGLVTGAAAQRDVALAELAELRAESGDQIAPNLAFDLDAVAGVAIVLSGRDGSGEGSELIRSAGRLAIGLSAGLDSPNQDFLVEGLVMIEEYELAELLGSAAVWRSRAIGDIVGLSGVLWSEGYRRLRIGDWTGSLASLEEAVHLAETSEMLSPYAVARATLMVLQAAQGDPSFDRDLDRLERIARDSEFDIIEIYTSTAAGLFHLGAGRPAEAAEAFERARTWTRDAGQFEPCVLSWPADIVEAYLLAGDRSTAIERLEELRQQSLVAERPWAVAAVARLDGLVAGDDDYAGHFERALEIYARSQAPFDEARTRLFYGRRLRRTGQRGLAREQLTEAVGTFDRLGAAPWAEQARTQLEATGQTLRRGPRTDPSRLTPQEQQVADLVAEGATNKEVAGRLFLSPKTVEAHLSRIYRKLGVSSRTQLAARMHADGG